MIGVKELEEGGLLCDTCGQGFVEVLELDNDL